MGRIFRWLICADKHLPDLGEYIQVLTYQLLSDDKTEPFFALLLGLVQRLCFFITAENL